MAVKVKSIDGQEVDLADLQKRIEERRAQCVGWLTARSTEAMPGELESIAREYVAHCQNLRTVLGLSRKAVSMRRMYDSEFDRMMFDLTQKH